jgi:hypothetical protein
MEDVRTVFQLIQEGVDFNYADAKTEAGKKQAGLRDTEGSTGYD